MSFSFLGVVRHNLMVYHLIDVISFSTGIRKPQYLDYFLAHKTTAMWIEINDYHSTWNFSRKGSSQSKLWNFEKSLFTLLSSSWELPLNYEDKVGNWQSGMRRQLGSNVGGPSCVCQLAARPRAYSNSSGIVVKRSRGFETNGLSAFWLKPKKKLTVVEKVQTSIVTWVDREVARERGGRERIMAKTYLRELFLLLLSWRANHLHQSSLRKAKPKSRSRSHLIACPEISRLEKITQQKK